MSVQGRETVVPSLSLPIPSLVSSSSLWPTLIFLSWGFACERDRDRCREPWLGLALQLLHWPASGSGPWGPFCRVCFYSAYIFLPGENFPVAIMGLPSCGVRTIQKNTDKEKPKPNITCAADSLAPPVSWAGHLPRGCAVSSRSPFSLSPGSLCLCPLGPRVLAHN